MISALASSNSSPSLAMMMASSVSKPIDEVQPTLAPRRSTSLTDLKKMNEDIKDLNEMSFDSPTPTVKKALICPLSAPVSSATERKQRRPSRRNSAANPRSRRKTITDVLGSPSSVSSKRSNSTSRRRKSSAGASSSTLGDSFSSLLSSSKTDPSTELIQQKLGITRRGYCRRHANQVVLFQDTQVCPCRICTSEQQGQAPTKSKSAMRNMAKVVKKIDKLQSNKKEWRRKTSILYNGKIDGFDDANPSDMEEEGSGDEDIEEEIKRDEQEKEENGLVQRIRQVRTWNETAALKNNPIYTKYYRQMQIGVPIEAVKHTCKMDGYLPWILDLDKNTCLQDQLDGLQYDPSEKDVMNNILEVQSQAVSPLQEELDGVVQALEKRVEKAKKKREESEADRMNNVLKSPSAKSPKRKKARRSTRATALVAIPQLPLEDTTSKSFDTKSIDTKSIDSMNTNEVVNKEEPLGLHVMVAELVDDLRDKNETIQWLKKTLLATNKVVENLQLQVNRLETAVASGGETCLKCLENDDKKMEFSTSKLLVEPQPPPSSPKKKKKKKKMRKVKRRKRKKKKLEKLQKTKEESNFDPAYLRACFQENVKKLLAMNRFFVKTAAKGIVMEHETDMKSFKRSNSALRGHIPRDDEFLDVDDDSIEEEELVFEEEKEDTLSPRASKLPAEEDLPMSPRTSNRRNRESRTDVGPRGGKSPRSSSRIDMTGIIHSSTDEEDDKDSKSRARHSRRKKRKGSKDLPLPKQSSIQRPKGEDLGIQETKMVHWSEPLFDARFFVSNLDEDQKAELFYTEAEFRKFKFEEYMLMHADEFEIVCSDDEEEEDDDDEYEYVEEEIIEEYYEYDDEEEYEYEEEIIIDDHSV